MKEKIIAGLMLPWLAASSVFANGKDNQKELVKEPITMEYFDLTNKIKPKNEPKISIVYNHGYKEQKKSSHERFKSCINDPSLYNTPQYNIISDMEISEKEKNEVQKIFANFNPLYSEVIKSTQNFDEEQKLLAQNVFESLIYQFFYSNEIKIRSQQEVNSALYDFLKYGTTSNLGNCGPISIYGEKFGEDMGLKEDVVSGVTHFYNIVDTKKGIAIIDGGELVRLKDNYDVEKILSIYQKIRGKTAFHQNIFDKGKFTDEIITENGKRFLEGAGNKNAKNSLEKTILNPYEKPDNVKIEINNTNYLKSASMNLEGVFVRGCKIKGESAMENMNFLQFGFDRNFLFKDMLETDINVNYIEGDILELRKADNSPEEYEHKEFIARGYMIDLGLAYSNKYGKIAARESFIHLFGRQGYKENISEYDEETKTIIPKFRKVDVELLYKNEFGFAASGNVGTPINNLIFKPYLISEFGIYPKDYTRKEDKAYLQQYGGGLSTELKISPIKIEINPYYFEKMNEREYGAKGNIELGINGNKFGIEGNFSNIKSDYIFNLNKRIWGAGLNAQIKGWNIGFEYENEKKSDIYNRWNETEHNFNLNASYSFNAPTRN